MPLLTCQGLTRLPFLAGIDLVLEPGTSAVLSGPSGSGKTLLLRALADLDPVEAGSISLNGRARESYASCDWRLRVTYVHQGGVLGAGTIAQHVERVTSLRAVRGADANALLRTLDAAGLDRARDTATLSGGERQSVALHLALHLAPDVLLLDEATSAMDPALAAASEERVRAFVEGSRSVLWISHDPSLAERLGAVQLDFRTLSVQ